MQMYAVCQCGLIVELHYCRLLEYILIWDIFTCQGYSRQYSSLPPSTDLVWVMSYEGNPVCLHSLSCHVIDKGRYCFLYDYMMMTLIKYSQTPLCRSWRDLRIYLRLFEFRHKRNDEYRSNTQGPSFYFETTFNTMVFDCNIIHYYYI